jgi:glycosyltransferase involved in cell wall biosynthesis
VDPNRPTISVVIPCYNGARFLRETLASVLSQTYPAHEVILVDDGSTDDSAAVAESFGPPVRVLRQTNQGESVARNRAIDAALGEWVALLDADDVWEPQKLERQMDVARELPTSFVCVYTDHYFVQPEKVLQDPRPEYHALPYARVRLLFDWCITPSSALIRRDVLRKVRFPETVRLGEDHIFFSQLRGHGQFARVPEPLTGYRLSPSQQTRGRNFHFVKMRGLCRWFKDNISRYSPGERDYFFNRIRCEVVEPHDKAYWERRLGVVRACRAVFFEAFDADVAPPLFRKRLFPAPVYRVRDWVDRMLAKRLLK